VLPLSFRPLALALGCALAPTIAPLVLVVPGASVAQAQSAGGGVRVEGIAALVGGTAPGPGTATVLRSDVVLRARIRLAGQTSRLPVGPLPEGLLAATLDEIVGEVLIAREADRLRAESPSDASVAEQRRRLEAQAGGAARLASLLRAVGASDEEVEAIARRRAYVDAFLRANLEGSTVVSDAQVQRVHEEGRHPFVGRPLPEIREVLRAWIAQQVLERDVRRWIEVLRSRTTVRVLARWRSGDEGDGG
jgi:hypothetical protein